MRPIAALTMACMLAACVSTPVPQRNADTARCDALAGDGWQRTAAPDVGADLLALAHLTTAPEHARWYIAADCAHAACLPPEADAPCGHTLHTFQPQVHRMWGWSESTVRRERCAAG